MPRCKKCNHDHYNFQNCPSGKHLTNPVELAPPPRGWKASGGFGTPFGTGTGKAWGGVSTFKHAPVQHGAVSYPVQAEPEPERDVRSVRIESGFESTGSLTIPTGE